MGILSSRRRRQEDAQRAKKQSKLPFYPGVPMIAKKPGAMKKPYPAGVGGYPYPPVGKPYRPGVPKYSPTPKGQIFPPGVSKPFYPAGLAKPPYLSGITKPMYPPGIAGKSPKLGVRPPQPGVKPFLPALVKPPYSPNIPGFPPQLQGKKWPKSFPFPQQMPKYVNPYQSILPNWRCERVGDPLINLKGSGFQQAPLSANCPNDLNVHDFDRIALLSGLDVTIVKQLWFEFQQLTGGRGELGRDQYRNIFLSSLYGVAMQNLEMLAEETFRLFDRDKNGRLDFFDFISAYKNNTPLTDDGKLSNRMENYGL